MKTAQKCRNSGYVRNAFVGLSSFLRMREGLPKKPAKHL
jgi:hypothetical protein